MKKLVKFVPLVIMLATLAGCYFSCGPIQIGSLSYTLTDSALPDINVQVTPFIPPRALDTLSGWVRVDVTIGTIHFSTDDPRFKCFESLVPFIIADDFAFPGFYIAVYNNCFQGGYSRPASGAMIASLPLDNQVAMFKFPRDNSLCSQGQCILPLNPPTPSPTPIPTPTLTPVTSIINFKASLSTSSEQCSDFKQALPPFTLHIDNTGSNVDVAWSATFREQSPSGSPWGSGPPTGVASEGGIQDVAIIPASDLCNVPANSVDMYHTDISYISINQGRLTITLTYTVFGVRIT